MHGSVLLTARQAEQDATTAVAGGNPMSLSMMLWGGTTDSVANEVHHNHAQHQPAPALVNPPQLPATLPTPIPPATEDMSLSIAAAEAARDELFFLLYSRE